MNNNISLQSLVTFVLFPIQLAICLGAIESSAASDPCVIDVPFAGGTPTLNDSRTIFPSHAHDPGNAFAPIVYTHKAIERAGGPIRRISTIFWPLLAEGVGFGKPYEVKSRFAFPDKIHLGSAVMEQYGATDGYGKIAVVGRNWGEPSASTGKSDSSQKPSASIWLSEAGEKFQILPYFKGANEVPDRIKWAPRRFKWN